MPMAYAPISLIEDAVSLNKIGTTRLLIRSFHDPAALFERTKTNILIKKIGKVNKAFIVKFDLCKEEQSTFSWESFFLL